MTAALPAVGSNPTSPRRVPIDMMMPVVVLAVTASLLAPPLAVAQQKTVTGTVISQQGQPLTGVSVNVAITNLVMDAVNHGYSVVLPRDAVAGWPRDYADAVIDNTLVLLATVVTTDDLVAAWAS